jgi:phosphomannomutase
VQLERPLKVVADAGNGVAGDIAPRLLEAIGAEVIPLLCDVDGNFPNHHPDPSEPANLQDLIQSVQRRRRPGRGLRRRRRPPRRGDREGASSTRIAC